MMSTWSLIGVVVVLLAVATCLAVNPYNDIVNDSRSFSSRQPLNGIYIAINFICLLI